MTHEKALAICFENCPNRIDYLWDTTVSVGSDTAWAIVHQYKDSEEDLATLAARTIGAGYIPEEWEPHTGNDLEPLAAAEIE